MTILIPVQQKLCLFDATVLVRTCPSAFRSPPIVAGLSCVYCCF